MALLAVVGDKSEYYSSVDGAGAIASSGRATPGQHYWGAATTAVIRDVNQNQYLSKLNTVGTVNDPLPAVGTPLTAGEIYAWDGQNVIVRQSHTRTEHDPDIVPALFSVYRADSDRLDWIANEEVWLGDDRKYGGIMYDCIQPHTTQAGWTPDVTPALWSVLAVDPDGNWTVGVAYAVGDIVLYDAVEYRCLQAHTGQAGWEPSVAATLWELVDPGTGDDWPDWVQPTGAHDAYNAGDQVTFNSTHWISTAANNVWAPGVYGWEMADA